jgi:succinyl-diaminopimelate desuccinylase
MDYVDLLRSLVTMDTTNNPVQRQQPSRECPKYLQDQFASLGLRTELLDQDGYYSVLALRGTSQPVTLLLAHFDVVPTGPGWNSNPFELVIRNGLGYGRGTVDDKGNVVALLLTAQALASTSFPGTVAFAVTGDEEIGGTHGAPAVRRWLEQRDSFPTYLVTADGQGMRIVTRRRNTCGFTITVPKQPHRVRGTPITHRFTTEFWGRETRHAAYFAPGVDRHALLAASSYLCENPDTVVAGLAGNFVKGNVVPDMVELQCLDPRKPSKSTEYDANLTRLVRALLPISRISFATGPSDFGITSCPNVLSGTGESWEVYFDCRAMTTDAKAVETALQTALAQHLAGINYKATVHIGPAFMNTPETARLVQAAQKVAEKLGLDSQPTELAGASDTRHFTTQPVEAIDYGPVGYGHHGANEHVVLESIPRTADFYIQLVQALHKWPKD